MMMFTILVILLSTQIVESAVASAPSLSLVCGTVDLSFSLPYADLQTRANNRNYTISFAQSSCLMSIHNNNQSGNFDWAAVPYSDCGINVYESNGDVVYNQTIIVNYGTDPPAGSNLVFRETLDEYNIKCSKPSNLNVTSANGLTVTTDPPTKINETALTYFDVTLGRKVAGFGSSESSSEAKLGDMLYYQLDFTTPRADLQMYPQQCYAVKDSASNAVGDKYPLIAGRCQKDSTVSFSQARELFQLSFEAFRYFDTTAVHFRCEVVICKTSVSGGLCTVVTVACAKKRRAIIEESGEIGEQEKPAELKVDSPVIYILERQNTVATTKDHASSPSVFEGTKGTIIIVLLAVVVIVGVIALIKKILLPAGQAAHAVSMKSVAGYDNNGMA